MFRSFSRPRPHRSPWPLTSWLTKAFCALSVRLGGRTFMEPANPSVNDEMRTLLRSWVACMQKPRPKDWEKIADNLCKDTWLFLGDLSTKEHDAGRRD